MSTTAAPPRIANNLDYSREQVRRAGAGENRSHGFDYAIQPDGASLAEQKWRALQRSARTCFKLHNTTTNNNAPRISLCDLDRRMRSASQQYQQRRRLPPAAVAPSANSNSTTNRNYAALQTNPPPTHPNNSNSGNLPPPQLLPAFSFNKNNNTNNSNGRENSENGFQSASAILASHCNSKTNSNYDALSPPASSATSASNFSAPPSRPIHSTAAAAAAAAPPPLEKNNNTAALPPPEADIIHIDDELDDALSNLDMEQLMSHQSNNHFNNDKSHHHHPRPPPSRAALPNNPLGGGGSNHNNNPYNNNNNNNNFTGMYNSSNNNFGAGFDFYDNSTVERRVSDIDSSGDAYQQTPTTTNNYYNTSNANNSSYNTVSSSSLFDSSLGGFSNNNKNNFDSYSPTYTNNSSINNQNSNGLGGGFGDNFNNDFYQNQWQNHQSPDGAPSCLCPEHNLPCMVLTARSEANNGRDFFKCSVPDGGCGFVGWVDGMEGNWNNTAMGDAPVATSPGDYKDFTIEARHKFGHRSFRPGQREVIQNAMAKRDVFVLMPTGGGKSLCYQLPAWCCPGLTVVVSPLLSLIQDQCQSMNTLGVESVFLASTQDYASEQMDITRRLNEVQPHGGVKLLYITPEKLSNSNMMQNMLRRIYQKGLLSRFIVDEAHCVSDWGHDFRPDYNKLGMLRTEYPGVPLMALTATANSKVVNDAIRALRMQNEFRYVSSFNRPNLRYEVRKKDGKTIDNIADYVAQRPNDSGVIYCLSRKNCEDVAQKIQEKLQSKPDCRGVRVSFYHAELDAHERERRHHEWSNGRISVLCATIAFGMGIDKPDVRYVIHFSMPKSITHYYQESGRAGRDRDVADCILYYQYKDKNILENMIVKSSNDPYGPATRRKIDQLYTCVRYCEDQFRCRRTMQLEFFGETFDRSKCNKTCDNCQAERVPDRRDFTSEAQTILRLFDDVSKQKRGTGVTLTQLSELYRGSKSQAATKFLDTSRLQGYGAGSKYKKYEIDRIVHAMVFDRIISESSVQNKGGFNSEYVNLAENAANTRDGRRNFMVDFPKPTKKALPATKAKPATKKKKTTKKAAASKKGKSVAQDYGNEAIAIDDCDDEDYEIDNDNEILAASSCKPSTRSKLARSVLPLEHTNALSAVMKTLATGWASEAQILGNKLFYWNIMKNDVMKNIAATVPMSIEELREIDGLGENVIKEYGVRIVKAVAKYIENNDLQEYLATRPEAKKPKVAEVVDLLDDEDEFGSSKDIDFGSIAIPDSKPAATDNPKKASKYFGS